MKVIKKAVTVTGGILQATPSAIPNIGPADLNSLCLDLSSLSSCLRGSEQDAGYREEEAVIFWGISVLALLVMISTNFRSKFWFVDISAQGDVVTNDHSCHASLSGRISII